MKNLLIAVTLSIFFLSQMGCKKTTEEAINCSLESLLMTMHANVDPQNLKLFHFTFEYEGSGEFTLDNEIKWDFGDGTTETSQGKTIDHTYANTGAYTAKATYKLYKGSDWCSSYITKSIHVN